MAWETLEVYIQEEGNPDMAKQTEILNLLKTIWEESPGQTLLELICSCFAFGDISHISDDELRENLQALLSVDRERSGK